MVAGDVPPSLLQKAFGETLSDEDVRTRESSGNPLAQNPNTSARGLYQITSNARIDAEKFDKSLVGSNYDDPAVQERYRTAYKGELARQLKSKGVEVSEDNINRAWVIGAGGMKRLANANPNALLKDVLPASYFKKDKNGNSINPNLENKTVKYFMTHKDPYYRVKK
jgi:hypothetical protein